MNGNKLVNFVSRGLGLSDNLFKAEPFISELSRLNSDLAFAHAGVERVNARDFSVGIILQQLLGNDLSGVYRAGALARAGDVHNVIALVKPLLEEGFKGRRGHLSGCHAVAVADCIV